MGRVVLDDKWFPTAPRGFHSSSIVPHDALTDRRQARTDDLGPDSDLDHQADRFGPGTNAS